MQRALAAGVVSRMKIATLLAVAGLLALQDPPPDPKIDPPLQAALDRKDPTWVILLGRTQLVEPPAGFDAFCREHANRRRRELRTEVVAKLKAIAEPEQKAILKALGKTAGRGALWIVNAICLPLTGEEIRKAAALPEVKYVYAGQPLADPAGAAFTGAPKAEARPAFTAEKKTVPWNLEKIGAARVWKDLKITGEGALVAMLDAGVNYAHEDLKRNFWANSGEAAGNGKDDDGNGYVDDVHGFDFQSMTADVKPSGGRGGIPHGTLTSGIVAGDGTGGTVTGVAPRAGIMALKGMGGAVSCALAYQYAIANGADVINMSFSLPHLKNLRGYWRMMTDHAVCAGLVCVSGAGNFQQSEKIPEQQRIPEAIPSCISAGGLDEKLEVPPFASLGPVEWSTVKFYEDHPMPKGLTKPDVCGFTGPNYPVLSKTDSGYIDPNPNIKGNSFSSPHVSGVAALMLSANPDLPAWRVKEILEATARDVGDKGKDNRTGAGLADAFAAVEAAIKAAQK